MRIVIGVALGAAIVAAGPAAALAEETPNLARYFGFEAARPIVIDKNAGPFLVADFNRDGLNDLAIVNNSKSRIELHLQRATPLSEDELPALVSPNELAPSRYFERKNVSVAHHVGALAAFDLNHDRRIDLVYAGRPGEIVVLTQTEDGDFERAGRRRERALSTTRQGLIIADVMGDRAPEIIALVGGRLHVYPYSNGVFGEPVQLGSGAADDQLVAVMAEDFNGDSLMDLIAVAPEHALPLRMWLQRSNAGSHGARELGAEWRFEMPALRDVTPLRFPDRQAASIAVIERASRRLAFYDLAAPNDDTSNLAAETRPERRAWPGASDRARPYAAADLDDGRLTDLIVLDPAGNATLVYRQRPVEGLGAPARFSTLKNPTALAVGQWDDDAPLEVFVLSEDEQTVGVCQFVDGELDFPQPIRLATSGATPLAIGAVRFADGPGLAVVVRERRDYALELHTPNGEPTSIVLDNLRRAPGAILAADVSGDGHDDLMLLTPNEPMTLILSDESGRPTKALTNQSMPHFGLVQAAGPNNTALLDVDGDGAWELLIADQNFVRACTYDVDSGWRVLQQVSSTDAQASLSGLAVFDSVEAARLLRAPGAIIAAADSGSGAILLIGEKEKGDGWSLLHRIDIAGQRPAALAPGSFSGRGAPELLSPDATGFSLIKLTGGGASLQSFEAWRADNENRIEHEIAVGDVNSDGYVDLICLDARQQMCQIFTFSASRRLHFATEFKVFETRLFEGGDSATYEPSSAVIADLTGDGADDLALLVHDRVMIYPQMTQPE